MPRWQNSIWTSSVTILIVQTDAILVPHVVIGTNNVILAPSCCHRHKQCHTCTFISSRTQIPMKSTLQVRDAHMQASCVARVHSAQQVRRTVAIGFIKVRPYSLTFHSHIIFLRVTAMTQVSLVSGYYELIHRRYALINGSSAPSITASTFPDSSFVL